MHLHITNYMKISFCKKQYLYLILAIISICLAFSTHVFAQTPEVANEAASVSARGGDDAKLTTTENTEQPQIGKINRGAQERIINLIRNTTHRMEGALLRLENVIMRLETRMDKLVLEGIDSPEARTTLEDAKNKLAEARQQLFETRALAEAALLSEDPRPLFTQARSNFTNIRISIKDSYTLIRTALTILKESVRTAQSKPTATANSVETLPTETTPVTN